MFWAQAPPLPTALHCCLGMYYVFTFSLSLLKLQPIHTVFQVIALFTDLVVAHSYSPK